MPRAVKRNGKAKRVRRKPKGPLPGKRRDTRENQKAWRAKRRREGK